MPILYFVVKLTLIRNTVWSLHRQYDIPCGLLHHTQTRIIAYGKFNLMLMICSLIHVLHQFRFLMLMLLYIKQSQCGFSWHLWLLFNFISKTLLFPFLTITYTQFGFIPLFNMVFVDANIAFYGARKQNFSWVITYEWHLNSTHTSHLITSNIVVAIVLCLQQCTVKNVLIRKYLIALMCTRIHIILYLC